MGQKPSEKTFASVLPQTPKRPNNWLLRPAKVTFSPVLEALDPVQSQISPKTSEVKNKLVCAEFSQEETRSLETIKVFGVRL